MHNKNFILLDVMKTGYHENFRDFINLNSLSNEELYLTQEYYDVTSAKIQGYTRKLAILDIMLSTESFFKNEEYVLDLEKRIKNLTVLGFKFIIAHPWESEDNMKNKKYYYDCLKGIKYLTWPGKHNYFWFLMNKKHKNQNYNFKHDNKKYDFLYLNKQSRTHRKKLFDALQKESLLDRSLISFLDPPHNIKLSSAYELPWVDHSNYPRYGSDQDIYEPQFNDCAFNLISETNDNNHDVFITEKLWKPIIAQQIFVVHGNLGYLKKLREMGFRTFDSVFDESYDQESDPDKRIEKLVSLCRHLRTMDKSKIYKETESIRQHNYDKFFDKTALSDAVNETVLGFLKFADRS
jgi:hypothetical protein